MDEGVFEAVRRDNISISPQNCIYLDHAGATLPRRDMINNIMQELLDSTISLGNPHTNSVIGRNTEETITSTREDVLDFFEADDYDIIFTSNATHAMKLVAEAFPWTKESILCYPTNSHTSLLGMRAYADNVVCVNQESLQDLKEPSISESSTVIPSQNIVYNLLLVPGECNYTGTKVNLSDIGVLSCNNDAMKLLLSQGVTVKNHETILRNQSDEKWLWFLDAAKLASTSKLSLRSIDDKARPHFVSVSFYKIFGYPTGIGALLVRNDVKHLLKKKYYGGGTVAAISAVQNYLVERSSDSLGSIFEDGTPNYHGIAALRHGLRSIESMGGMINIQSHTFTLANYLAHELLSLRHDQSSNRPVVKVFGHFNDPSKCFMNTQGSIVTFNLFWVDESPVGFSYVSQLAEANNIILRTGCFCNPGGCQELLEISTEEVKQHYEEGRTCGSDSGDVINGKVTGSIRVSLGFSSVLSDCHYFIQFVKDHFQNKSNPNSSSHLSTLDLSTLTQTSTSTSTSLPSSSLSSMNKDSKQSTDVYLSELIIYPIKSCGGYQISSYWPVSSTGLYLDRKWAVADTKTNRILTQKNYPILAQVCVIPDLVSKKVVISHPSMIEKVDISIIDNSELNRPKIDKLITDVTTSNDLLTVRLCGRQQKAIASNDEALTSSCTHADEWFSKLIGQGIKCRLVEATDQLMNSLDNQKSSFVNEAQLLVISQESVTSLSEVLKNQDLLNQNLVPITVANFRPNFVTYGGTRKPHQEDTWESLEIDYFISDRKWGLFTEDLNTNIGKTPTGIITWKVAGPCSRCSAININGNSGSIDGRVLETVGKYRKNGYKINFGQFLEWQVSSTSTSSTSMEGNDSNISIETLNQEPKHQEILYIKVNSKIRVNIQEIKS